MPYTILVTPTATDDIAVAIEYYNLVAADLGYRFADLIRAVVKSVPFQMKQTQENAS